MDNPTQPELDLLVIGELNMDLILNGVSSFPELGKEKIARELNLTLGSSSAIFAGNSAGLGLSVAFCGMIGEDYFGRTVTSQLNDYGVDTSLITTSGQYQTGLTAIIRHAGDRAMITYPGAMEHFSLAQIPDYAFTKARHLHISSLFLQPGIKDDLWDIIVQAKAHNMTISIDTQWDPAEAWELNFEKLLSEIDFFLPNENEFLQIAGTNSVEQAIQKFQPCLGEGVMVIKQGIRGATYVTSDRIETAPGYVNEHPVDTVGAGDSFDAGVICRFLQGRSLEQCISYGNMAGAVSTTAAGGTKAINRIRDIEQFAKTNFSINQTNDSTG